jgi:hypothetical protein
VSGAAKVRSSQSISAMVQRPFRLNDPARTQDGSNGGGRRDIVGHGRRTERGAKSRSPPRSLLTSSASTPSMFEHLSILTVGSPVSTVLDVSLVHNTMPSNLIAALGAKLRRRGIVLNHFFRLNPPARIVADLTMRSRNDLNCGTCDSEYKQQLNSENRV